MKKKNILVLSGGGIKGVSYMGCLIALQELGYYEHIDTFAGASIGGLISALCILGYTPEELKKFIINFEIGKAKCINFLGIVLEFGLDNGSKLELVVKKLIKAKKYPETITLNELYNATKKNLYLTTTCVNTKKIVCLNHTTHPNLPLHMAIRMTTAIPFFYTPVKYENKLYIDGGCMDNYPISVFNDKLDKVIGLYLCDDDDDVAENIDNIEAYLSKVIQCLMMGVDQNYVQRFHQCTTVIKLKGINSINYDISAEKKQERQDINNKIIFQYKKYFNACLDKIKSVNKLNRTAMYFEVPNLMHLYSSYNSLECLEYIQKKLTKLNVRSNIVSETKIVIDWGDSTA